MSGVQLSLPLAGEAPAGITSRYAAFLQATGRTVADRSIMTNVEFMAWVRRKWVEFAAAFGRSPEHHTEVDQIDFDNWLTKGGVQ